MRHVFVKSVPASMTVPSATVTSVTNEAASHRIAGAEVLFAPVAAKVGKGLVAAPAGVALAASETEA
jgi:hypothetical protein